jgi:hypothetical protein
MRNGLVSALCAVLALLYTSSPAVAQSKPVSPQLPQSFLQRLSPPSKLSEFSTAHESARLGLLTDLQGELSNELRGDNLLLDRLRKGSDAMELESPAAQGRCAHIVIYQAPLVDSGIFKEVPKGSTGTMLMLGGLQACCRDFHRSWLIPQMVPSVGPGRIGPLAPNTRMVFDGLQP